MNTTNTTTKHALTALHRLAPAALALALALSLAACATGGAATASGANSVAKGGDAKTDVTVSNSLSLGDSVARAASDAVKTLLAPVGGVAAALDAAQRNDVIEKGVAAGLAKAKEENREPTAAEAAELRAFVEKKLADSTKAGN